MKIALVVLKTYPSGGEDDRIYFGIGEVKSPDGISFIKPSGLLLLPLNLLIPPRANPLTVDQ